MLPTTKTPPRNALADLAVLVYGPTKIGKTTWCSHADGALFLATEAGLNNLETFQVPISTWEQLLAACGEIAAGNHPFKTVIVDTVDNLYRMCADYVCAKHKVEHESDLAFGKGYALITERVLPGAEQARAPPIRPLADLPRAGARVRDADREGDARSPDASRQGPEGRPRDGRPGPLLRPRAGPRRGREAGARRVMRTKPSASYEAADRTGRLPETIELDWPPGKRNSSISQLSGGEKALAATAVLFSIFRYQPPPFCLLDEVDAPLDDANGGRFTEAVRWFTDATQFILVTHNKRTMEMADILYGITMPEPGVSNIVSMTLE